MCIYVKYNSILIICEIMIQYKKYSIINIFDNMQNNYILLLISYRSRKKYEVGRLYVIM